MAALSEEVEKTRAESSSGDEAVNSYRKRVVGPLQAHLLRSSQTFNQDGMEASVDTLADDLLIGENLASTREKKGLQQSGQKCLANVGDSGTAQVRAPLPWRMLDDSTWPASESEDDDGFPQIKFDLKATTSIRWPSRTDLGISKRSAIASGRQISNQHAAGVVNGKENVDVAEALPRKTQIADRVKKVHKPKRVSTLDICPTSPTSGKVSTSPKTDLLRPQLERDANAGIDKDDESTGDETEHVPWEETTTGRNHIRSPVAPLSLVTFRSPSTLAIHRKLRRADPVVAEVLVN